MHDDPILLTVAEAARRLRLGRTMVYELLASGALRSVRIGRARRVPIGALDEFVAGLSPALPQVAGTVAASSPLRSA